MAAKKSVPETPLYCLDAFSQRAKEYSFYMENFQRHLKNNTFINKPHKHDFYLLLYITRGSGTHTIDFQNYPLRPRSFFLMTPGQVHSWTLSADTDGVIIFFTKDFFRMRARESNLLELPFFQTLQQSPLVKLPPDKAIDFIFQDMLTEFSNPSAENNFIVLRSYLDVLLLKVARLLHTGEQEPSVTTATLKLRQLEQLIERHYITLKEPHAYSEMMHVSPSHLNAICKKTLGKTLSDLITERVLLEARRLFAYSDMTVKQVSEKLSFTTPSYFIRFFKKHTGQTPEQFKESLNRAIQ